MARLIIIFICLLSFSYSKVNKLSIYYLNCVGCHKRMPVSIDKYFYRYLLKYSSEKDVKKALFDYLKNPQKEKSVMPEEFIQRFKIKKKSNLTDKKLKKAIDDYWDIYKIFGKLK